MGEVKKQKKKNQKKLEWIIVAIVLLLIVGLILYSSLPKPRKIMYCHFEKNVSDELPRYECFNMKIISRDLDLINLEQFEELDITTYSCSKKYNEFPSCGGQNLYFTDYALDLFCENCSFDGFIAVEYFIDYYTNETWKIEQFEGIFMKEKFDSAEKLHERFLEYEGRSTTHTKI